MMTALQSEFSRCNPIPFWRFMELALYAPQQGYYEQEGARVGRGGDFYTSVTTGSLFGELLAFQFSKWLEETTTDHPRLVESGAHDGALAEDILLWLAANRPSQARKIEYLIVEPSPARQRWQRQRLEHFAGQVSWVSGWKELPQRSICGVLFSNELLDAFPVRRFGWDAISDVWFEWGVLLEKDELTWTQLPVDSAPLALLFAQAGLVTSPKLERVLPDGFTIEMSTTAAEWWRQSAEALHEGRLLAVDYGLTADEVFLPHRSQGTLRAYRQHQLQRDPLANPGNQDLTAHVNFSWLRREAEAAGLYTEGLYSQERFLLEIARRTMDEGNRFEAWSEARCRQLRTLTHPEHLGRPFRVLLQRRNAGAR